jgi:hypothetical protein
MEKQYTCMFCTNRFKNKNEAERHQNTLHLRRHSWSCANISDWKAAFHPTTRTTPASLSDLLDGLEVECGFCGEKFANFTERAQDQMWDHITNRHKFRECNTAKKFFRADHFRMHLKHSHAGTSGRWTNMLENACMKDEPAPGPLPKG